MNKLKSPNEAKSTPWWRERVMWLVVGGPSAVVLASFATLALALIYPDPVVDDHQRPAADKAGEPGAGAVPAVDPAHLPALKARNHAATGGR